MHMGSEGWKADPRATVAQIGEKFNAGSSRKVSNTQAITDLVAKLNIRWVAIMLWLIGVHIRLC